MDPAEVAEHRDRTFVADIAGDPLLEPESLTWGAHAELRELEWDGWGDYTATAAGSLYYADAHGSCEVPVRVKLSQREVVPGGWLYVHTTVEATDIGSAAEIGPLATTYERRLRAAA